MSAVENWTLIGKKYLFNRPGDALAKLKPTKGQNGKFSPWTTFMGNHSKLY